MTMIKAECVGNCNKWLVGVHILYKYWYITLNDVPISFTNTWYFTSTMAQQSSNMACYYLYANSYKSLHECETSKRPSLWNWIDFMAWVNACPALLSPVYMWPLPVNSRCILSTAVTLNCQNKTLWMDTNQSKWNLNGTIVFFFGGADSQMFIFHVLLILQGYEISLGERKIS